MKTSPSLCEDLIRRTWLLVSLTVLAFGLAMYFLILSPLFDRLAASELRQGAEIAGERVELLFEDIERMIDTARRWGLREQFTLDDLHGFDGLFEPFVASQPRVTSLLFADERGREFLLLKMPNGEWRNRVSDPQRWGQRQQIFSWRDSPPPLTEGEWQERDYDARRRPWYQGALALTRDGELHWTEPYQFFTTREPGITVSTHWHDPHAGQLRVLALDVKLFDLSRFTQSVNTSANGQVAIMTPDSRLLGLPRHPRFENDEQIRASVLKTAAENDLPQLAKAFEQWRAPMASRRRTCCSSSPPARGGSASSCRSASVIGNCWWSPSRRAAISCRSAPPTRWRWRLCSSLCCWWRFCCRVTSLGGWRDRSRC